MINEIYLYFADNLVQCYHLKSNRFIEIKLSKRIFKEGKIIHRPKFLHEFKVLLKKYKLIKNFQKNKIYLITPPNFEEVDKEIIKIIFEDLPIQELKLIKETSLYKMKKNELWINFNETYAFLTTSHKEKKETIIWNDIGFNFLEVLKRFLLSYPRIKKIIIIGHGKLLYQKVKEIEKECQKKTFYYEEPHKFLLTYFTRLNRK
ncbi:MAG: hypothetical protein HFH86_03390 [Bacilli bacterium]|nr:hypothetical protein [Bacilli bacterium]